MTSDIFYMGADETYVLMMALTVFAVMMLLIIGYGIVCYIFQSISLYTIAKRRGIKNPWLAWLPFGDYWIIGSISDDFRLTTKGELTHRRMLVLGLMGGATVVSFLQSLGSFRLLWFMLQNIDMLMTGAGSAELEAYMMQMAMAGTSPISALLSLAVTGAEIAGMVFIYMSLYDIYASCRPWRKVLFLVLSILFGLHPFFLFACRKSDYGMQPRRPQLPRWPNQNPNWPPQNPQWPPQNPQWPSQNPGQWPPQNPPQPPQNF